LTIFLVDLEEDEILVAVNQAGRTVRIALKNGYVSFHLDHLSDETVGKLPLVADRVDWRISGLGMGLSHE
jgi:hypothetical protein